ncbi:hypothetical protein O4J56_07455 [Nocardiopsis sp. RSe5-2]|uniref:DUF4436 domain-containing protein n=1 Tax=Nocardiopsis endophytica TaxID=3018445 RepID=A0ABT4U1S1_9ACTN|nr:hypothetical protein [Nocardiopsis endophytica]MDA2810469.1 hypothetical protein [Nocardiopsis endophytica]
MLSPGRILRSALGSVVALLYGFALVGGAAYAVAVNLADGHRDNRAYLAAEPCPSPPEEAAECLWEQEFTASDIVNERGRSGTRALTLNAEDGTRIRVDMDGRGPVLRTLDDGQKVTGTVWRGLPREIAAEGMTQRTGLYPIDMRHTALVLALILAPSGTVVAAVTGLRLIRWRRTPTRAMAAALGLGLALPFAGLLMPMFLGDLVNRLWAATLVWAVLAGLMTLTAWVCATYTPPKDVIDPEPFAKDR